MEPLRILHLEDDENDSELVNSVLEAGGIGFRKLRVQTRDAFTSALAAKVLT